MPVESIVRIQSIRKVQLVHTKSIRIQNYYSVEFSLNLPTGIDPKVKIKHVEMKFCCNVRFTISDPIRFIFIPAMTLNVIQVHTYALHADQCNLRKKFIFLPFFWVSSMRSFTCLSIRKMKIALSNSTMWNGIQLSFYLPHKINGMFFFNCMQFDDYKTSNNTQYTCIPHDICQALEFGNFIENCFLRVIFIFHTIMQIVRYTIWQLWHFKCCTLIRIKK